MPVYQRPEDPDETKKLEAKKQKELERQAKEDEEVTKRLESEKQKDRDREAD